MEILRTNLGIITVLPKHLLTKYKCFGWLPDGKGGYECLVMANNFPTRKDWENSEFPRHYWGNGKGEKSEYHWKRNFVYGKELKSLPEQIFIFPALDLLHGAVLRNVRRRHDPNPIWKRSYKKNQTLEELINEVSSSYNKIGK